MSQSCCDPGMDMSAQSFGYYVRIQEVDNESKIKRLNLKFLVYIILLIRCKANILLLLYCKCYIIVGAFELWWKFDTVYSFPEALRMQTCIMWNHEFPRFTSRSNLYSGTSSSSSGQIDGFCAWEFVFCIKWCWETEPHGKMAFHSRVPAWHSPKWVRLTDQGVYILHFEKNQDVYRAVWWPSVCLCISFFDNLFGLHVYYIKNKSIEGIILPGRRQFSEGCLFSFLTHDSFATNPDRYNQVTSFKCLPMGVKTIISNLL